ncbi:MAG: hypothetical protein KJ058_16305, partial [Thermoanaerobaculia bacterium]|nr:hypothetical protein [Thermoanaerobaculia bacterium]
RDGYWRRTSDQQLADTALAAASLGGADNPLGALLEVSVGERAGRRKEREVKALVRLPVPSLTLMPNGNGHAGKLAFEFAVRDEEGRVSRFEKREQTFSIPAEKLAAAAKQSIAYGIEMHLAPGSYTLATAVLDAVGGVRSTATIGFRVEK